MESISGYREKPYNTWVDAEFITNHLTVSLHASINVSEIISFKSTKFILIYLGYIF